jgi:hypothetical protein
VLIGKNIFANVSRDISSSGLRCPESLTSGSRVPRVPEDDDNIVLPNAEIYLSILTNHKS